MKRPGAVPFRVALCRGSPASLGGGPLRRGPPRFEDAEDAHLPGVGIFGIFERRGRRWSCGAPQRPAPSDAVHPHVTARTRTERSVPSTSRGPPSSSRCSSRSSSGAISKRRAGGSSPRSSGGADPVFGRCCHRVCSAIVSAPVTPHHIYMKGGPGGSITKKSGMPNDPAANRSPRPGNTRQAPREVLGYLIARPDPVRGAEEATHAGTMNVPRQFVRTDMRKQPGELELFSTEELIDELMKRTTFQGVIVHARMARRAGTGPASGSSGSASTRTSAPRRPAACSTS